MRSPADASTGEGGLSPQTAVHFSRVLNKAMKRAKKLRLIASNPIEDATPPKVEDKEMKTLTHDQARNCSPQPRPP